MQNSKFEFDSILWEKNLKLKILSTRHIFDILNKKFKIRKFHLSIRETYSSIGSIHIAIRKKIPNDSARRMYTERKRNSVKIQNSKISSFVEIRSEIENSK